MLYFMLLAHAVHPSFDTSMRTIDRSSKIGQLAAKKPCESLQVPKPPRLRSCGYVPTGTQLAVQRVASTVGSQSLRLVTVSGIAIMIAITHSAQEIKVACPARPEAIFDRNGTSVSANQRK